MTIYKLKEKKGFVILFAVTISAILLAVALGVLNIAYKEVKFSTSAKDTNDAFFAADTGAECALEFDSSVNSTNAFTGTGAMVCAGAARTVTPISSSDWSFVVTGLGSASQSCAKVLVSKSGVTTSVVSKGYNVGDSSCVSNATTRIEREIDVSYNIANASVTQSGPSISSSPSSISHGSDVTVSWANIPNPLATDWIGLYSSPKGSDYSHLAHIYAGSCTTTPGAVPPATGSCSFNIPYSIAAGTYVFQMFEDVPPANGLATSPSFSVTGGGASLTVKALVVGGGGSGGYYYGAGGGAGGYLYEASHSVSVGSYPITVGTGGSGLNAISVGNNGTSSVFDTMTAIGGGGGGAYTSSSMSGGNGGSGGGGGGGSGGSSGGLGSQGFNGEGATPGFFGGGGGGAGQAGGANGAGYGGNGITNSITGTSVVYAGGGAGLSSGQSNTASRGAGGGGMSDENATPNTGGGGGFAWNGPSGAGGSGAVIIAYPTGSITGATGGTVTTSGGFTIHKFTSSGTFTIPAQ